MTIVAASAAVLLAAGLSWLAFPQGDESAREGRPIAANAPDGMTNEGLRAELAALQAGARDHLAVARRTAALLDRGARLAAIKGPRAGD